MIRALFVVRDLHAESAVGEGMGGIAFYTDGAAVVIHIDEHGARVRTIVRANGSYGLECGARHSYGTRFLGGLSSLNDHFVAAMVETFNRSWSFVSPLHMPSAAEARPWNRDNRQRHPAIGPDRLFPT